ncbi:MAG: hypothetical protein C4583_09210 [Anaerolineaceae bacterium]|nr:MAG: hypothetical protein C4583_09210 [Anaerolineaceae bacterium]
MSEHSQLRLFVDDEPDLINVEKDPEKSGLEEMDDRAFVRYCEKHAALIAKLEELGLPKPGQQFRIITRRTFNAIQFLEFIARQETILDLKMAIYSINFHAAKLLVKLVNEGYISRVEILMSNLRNKAHREKEEIVRKMFLGHPRIVLFFASSHAKVFSCSTAKGNYYTLEGSGNLAFNSRVENYVIDNDKALYDFTVSWMREIKVFLQGKKELELPS